MGKPTAPKTKQPVAPAPVIENAIEEEKVPTDTRKARRAVPRDAAIVLTLNTKFQEAQHVHDPIDPLEADRIFTFSVKGLADQLLLSVFTSSQHVVEDGYLSFQRDTKPVAPKNDRHASKLIRKRIKKRKQSYAAVKNYGNYAPSRASSRTESRFGGSRIGGSRASVSVRGARVSKSHKMSLVPMMNSPWIDSQQESIGSPSSIAGTARMSVDFAEIQRRTDIERDLHTRESDRLVSDEINRKNGLRLKLRSLADPTVSLEKEEAMAASIRAKGQHSRVKNSRQTNLSPLSSGTKGGSSTALAIDEAMTFRTEDYAGLTSDVVLFGRGGELLVGENCFVVEQKLRQELLLDLQTRGVIQPRIHLVPASKQSENNTTDGNPSKITHRFPPSPSPLRQTRVRSPSKLGVATRTSEFGNQIGSFDSSPTFGLDLQATPLAKGVVLKLADSPITGANASITRNLTRQKSTISENVPNAKLEKQLSALMMTNDTVNPSLASSQSVPELPSAQTTNLIKTSPSAGSPVLPKHIHNGEKHLQNLRIRTPAYPHRLSRRTFSRSNAFIDGDEYDWSAEDAEKLYSLEKHSSIHSLPNVKYMREFPKSPQGRIHIFEALPTPSPFSFAIVQHKR